VRGFLREENMAGSRAERVAVLAGEPFKEEGKVTYKEFEKLVSERGLNLLAAKDDVREFFEMYTLANHAGGEELERFVDKTLARYPDSFFQTKPFGESDLTVAEAMRVCRILAPQINFSRNGDEPNRMES